MPTVTDFHSDLESSL